MTRTPVWPLVAVSLSAAVLGFVGCHAQEEGPPSAHIPAPPPAPRPAGTKLLADWPKPAGALIVSGEQVGYLEPCGCTEGQQGGLGRRYDLIDRLRKQGWPLALIDLGSLADPPGARGGPVQSKVEFNVALRALAEMKYNALALSAEDMKLGVAETLTQYLNQNGQPKVVAANITPAQGFEGTLAPSVRAAAGPIRLGITAVLDPAAYRGLNDPDKDLLTVKPPRDVLPGVLADLEKDTDVQVLMVQGPPGLARVLGQMFPGFELVVATSEYVDPRENAETLNNGKTLMIQVGKKGKWAGVVGLYRDPKAPLRYRRLALNTSYRQAEPMRELIDQDFQNELKALKVVENYPKHGHPGAAPGAVFIGAAKCKECHPNTYARWASTKHAQAYEPLKKPEHNREHDAECISCHTTGFEYQSGFLSAETTPYLLGNQCENCHGPGSKHAEQPDNAEYSRFLARAVADPEQNRLCFRCHDEDNDPHFDFAKYYGQIVHKRMDDYNDPKVHQGLDPRTFPKAE